MRKFVLSLTLLLWSVCSFAGVLTPKDNGPYFDPAYNGSGVQLSVWNEGKKTEGAFTWYTYDHLGKQEWFFGVKTEEASSFDKFVFFKPTGYTFFSRQFSLGEPVGEAQVSRTKDGLRFNWLIYNFRGYYGCEGFSPTAPWCAGEYQLVPLLGAD